MGTLSRIAKNPVGMARLVTNYARIKELQNKMSIEDIADIFDENKNELKNFIEYSDKFVSGEKTFSLDITTKSKEEFQKVSLALAK